MEPVWQCIDVFRASSVSTYWYRIIMPYQAFWVCVWVDFGAAHESSSPSGPLDGSIDWKCGNCQKQQPPPLHSSSNTSNSTKVTAIHTRVSIQVSYFLCRTLQKLFKIQNRSTTSINIKIITRISIFRSDPVTVQTVSPQHSPASRETARQRRKIGVR